MNQSLFLFIHGFAGRSSLLDSFFVFSAEMLGPLMIALLLLLPFILRIHKKRETRVWVAFIILSALVARFGLTEIIRAFYPASRPFVVMPEIVPLTEHPPTNAFPSGHAVFYFALAAGTMLWMSEISSVGNHRTARTMQTLFLAGALLIGASRIVAGVHWPADVGVGWIVGGVTVWASYAFFRRRLAPVQPSSHSP